MNLDKLKVITYLNWEDIGDRAFNILPLWDGKEWHQWLPYDGGLLYNQKVIYSNPYLAASTPKSEFDVYIPFIDLMWQQGSFEKTAEYASFIFDDIQNIATSLSKIAYFHETKKNLDDILISMYVTTEIEYILISARSIFDYLYKIISYLWENKIKLNDEDAEKLRRSKKLPKRLSALLIKKDENGRDIPRLSDEIVDSYKIAAPLANILAKHASFFNTLRHFRDAVLHGGSHIQYIFPTEKGFCVGRQSPPFSYYFNQKKCDDFKYNENLVSLMPWLRYIVGNTINSCDEWMAVFAQCFIMPRPLAPNYKVYFGGATAKNLQDLLNEKLIWQETGY